MTTTQTPRTSFPKNFWTVIVMEFLERGAYYSVLSVLATFLVLNPSDGGLGFSKEAAGAISGTIQPLLYFLPILAGALADRYGYRRFLMLAFSFMVLGYGLIGMANTYVLVFGTLIIMALARWWRSPNTSLIPVRSPLPIKRRSIWGTPSFMG